ncbi:MAG: alcohol dehydrogenase catalytic domain-containing protein [Pirellulaceae bacterium]
MLLSEYKKLEVVDMPIPEVGPNDLLVEVKACGICGSDIHGWDGSSGRRVPPLVMGHEAAGIVHEVSSAVRGFQVGDRVTFDSTVSCGRCASCRRARSTCAIIAKYSVSPTASSAAGAFAEVCGRATNISTSCLMNWPSNMRRHDPKRSRSPCMRPITAS